MAITRSALVKKNLYVITCAFFLLVECLSVQLEVILRPWAKQAPLYAITKIIAILGYGCVRQSRETLQHNPLN